MKKVIQIHPSDNVGVALKAVSPDDSFTVGDKIIKVAQEIPSGHKIALEDLNKGDTVIKYGYPIGQATEFIKCGNKVDHMNMKTRLEGVEDYTGIRPSGLHSSPIEDELTFQGYIRKNGKVGIRNELWIIPTVGCVNGIASKIASQFKTEISGGAIDGVHAFTHPYGCSQLGDDHENTKKILRDMVDHPNAGGILIIGLGCENNQPEEFLRFCGDYDRQRIKMMICQEIEGDEVKEGVKLLLSLYEIARYDRRTPVGLSHLTVGLKCGGSDGLSGITANPLLGAFADFLCLKQGGSAVLTEVPEMFGAETILMQRCVDVEILGKTIEMVNGFKDYYLSHGEPVGENPSPGNKAGGISTLEEKSLGCIQKGGTTPVTDVIEYGGRVSKKGLTLLSAPGNDLIASTALAAAGCQLVLFTTGRGTPFSTFVPTAKISTNSQLAVNKKGWIDFNAGVIVEGKDFNEVMKEFVAFVIDIANGKKIKSELSELQEIAIFKTGVTL